MKQRKHPFFPSFLKKGFECNFAFIHEGQMAHSCYTISISCSVYFQLNRHDKPPQAVAPSAPQHSPTISCLFLRRASTSETDLFCLDSDKECGLNEH